MININNSKTGKYFGKYIKYKGTSKSLWKQKHNIKNKKGGTTTHSSIFKKLKRDHSWFLKKCDVKQY